MVKQELIMSLQSSYEGTIFIARFTPFLEASQRRLAQID
ncbi:hypothetical protein B8V81_0567 [Paenibacillus pasadenensis]|uniref:Uncharacterized protein n=1 Tax=Paenibacillus pasadenensis TaxID=217090 RepID=A0A2N5NDK7_9BACL|nr:hypothetical protein B8V81_0567 [Paenibacillus pasadenensis]